MKKKYLIIGSLIICLSLTACTKENNKNPDDTTSPEVTQLDPSTEPTAEPTQVPTPEPTEIPKIELTKTASFHNWDIIATNIRIVDTIQTSNYSVFKPEEGNNYIRVYLTITNKSSESRVFLPTTIYNDDIVAKLLHGTQEYISSKLLEYEKDLHDISIDANASIEKEIAFEIPTTIAESADELLLSFTSNEDTIVIKLR